MVMTTRHAAAGRVMFIGEEDLLLPPATRLLHIGPQKTGTTMIQGAMHRGRRELREHDVVYPGRGTRPREGVWAALDLQVPFTRPNPRIERWHALVEEVRAAGTMRVCVSTEDFAKAELEGARRVVRDLGQDRPHVVAVARGLDRLLPSQWQQRVKMRISTLTWEEWLTRVLGDDEDEVWQNVWVPHAIGPLTERWVEALGGDPAKFTLVIADEQDPRQLTRVFERLLGLPDGLLGDTDDGPRNPSIGIGRIETIRRLNLAYQTRGWGEHAQLDRLQRSLTDDVRTATPWADEEPVPPFPAWAAERIAELNEQRAALVRDLDVRVLGNPDDLRPAPRPVTRPPGTPMISSELAAAMVESTIETLHEQHAAEVQARDRRLEKLQRRLRRQRARPSPDDLSGRELLRLAASRARRRLRWPPPKQL